MIELMTQNIDKLNGTIQLLQSVIASKDLQITSLQAVISDFWENKTFQISSIEPPTVIVVPRSDEINQFRGKVIKIKEFLSFLHGYRSYNNLRRN